MPIAGDASTSPDFNIVHVRQVCTKSDQKVQFMLSTERGSLRVAYHQ